jgi:uncharacterized protein (DUF849 family)
VTELKPEICSLDIATMNTGSVRDDSIFLNSPGHLRTMAEMVRAAGTKPELEVFDTGHIRLARHMIDSGLIDKPPLFQLCLGIEWGAEATPATFAHLVSLLPKDANFAAFGISRDHFRVAALSVVSGGHVRVGLEDCLYLDYGRLAPSNAALVERAVQLITLLGEDVAAPSDARKLLGLRTELTPT